MMRWQVDSDGVRRRHWVGPRNGILGYVYIASTGTEFKIGWTTDPSGRMLGAGYRGYLAIARGMMSDEREILSAFRNLQPLKGGEYFPMSEEILEFARSLPRPASRDDLLSAIDALSRR